MLLTVVLLSGTVLGATTIAGLLMLYELRQVADVGSSARAIFAADTGVEWELYKLYRNPSYEKPRLTNGEEFETFSLAPGRIKSVGYSNANRKVARAFELDF